MEGYQPFGGIIATYGSLSLTVQSPAQSFIEPLTLTEVKEYLNLPQRSPADSNEDDMLTGYIQRSSRNHRDTEQGRDLVRKQWDLSFDTFWNYQIELREPARECRPVQYKGLWRQHQSDGREHELSGEYGQASRHCDASVQRLLAGVHGWPTWLY